MNEQSTIHENDEVFFCRYADKKRRVRQIVFILCAIGSLALCDLIWWLI